jgi:hypothetical protein
MKPDLEHITSGLFTRFVPVTPAGETAWREMEAQGGAQILTAHLPQVLEQLRAAGYTTRRARRVSDLEFQNILEELGI